MIETVSQLVLNTIKSYLKEDLILYKKEGEYVPVSTEEFGNQVKYFCLGLRDLGFEAGDKLVILSETRPEWVISDLASLCSGGITVPIYPSLVPDQIKYIIHDSDAVIVIYSTKEQWQKIDSIRDELAKVKHYITFAPEAPEGIWTFPQILERGKNRAQQEPEIFEKLALNIRSEDIASIIYTSGTTGTPKGVIITHSNFINNFNSICSIIEFSDKDTVLSFLPLSHVMERIATFCYLCKGCTIAYAESIETVPENLLEVKPHIMVSVPRVFEKIYAKVMDNVLSSSLVKRKIFFWALNVGKEYGSKNLFSKPISRWLHFKRIFANKLVFSKIIRMTGGRLKFFVSGGAPLSKDIAEFFCAIGPVVLEAYGLTENSPLISINTFDSFKFGTVGKPIPGVEVRIAQNGEILTRGPCVMKGYYKKERETKEVLEGSWLHTGDIGHMDQDGFLVITDRIKDIIVTAGGKNIAPQPIENLLKTNLYISNAVVIGDSRKFISSLIVPNFEKLKEYSKLNNIHYENQKDLIKKEQIINFMLEEVDRSTSSLASYEKVKKIILLDREFEIEKGEITPTLKVKRNIIEEKYKDLIDSIYRE